MRYLLSRKERLLLESKIYLSDKLSAYFYDIFKDDDREEIKAITRKLADMNGEEVDSRSLRKDEYVLDVSEKPNMIKLDDKTEIKLGRLLSLITDAPDHIKSEIVNKWKAYFDYENRGKFELIDGDIDEYYDCSIYANAKGSLGNSCMKNVDSERFGIYNHNESIKLLVLLDDDDKLLARSIIFMDTNWGSPVMNRIYTTDETDETTFQLYAKKQGWAFIDDLNVDELQVKIEDPDFDKYPYIDNVPYLNKTKGILSGSWEKWRGNFDEIIKLEDHVMGYWHPIQNSERSPNLQLKNLITDWEDVQYILRIDDFINYGIGSDFMEDYIEDESDYKIGDFENFYDGDDVVSYLRTYESDNFLINFAITPGSGFNISEYIFENQDLSVDEVNEIFKNYVSWCKGKHVYDNLKVKPTPVKTRDEQIKIVDKIIDVRRSESAFEQIENIFFIKSMMNNYLTIKDLEEYIEENYLELVEDNDMKEKIVKTELEDYYDDYDPSDVISELYGSLDRLEPHEIRHILDRWWDVDRFIREVERNGKEDYVLDHFIQE